MWPMRFFLSCLAVIVLLAATAIAASPLSHTFTIAYGIAVASVIAFFAVWIIGAAIYTAFTTPNTISMD